MLGVLGLVVALALAGGTYQVLAERSDRRTLPPPGRLIDVGGYRLHLDVAGQTHGGPAVVLDAAWGSTSAQWGWVVPEVARFARVVAYDRSGQGDSDPPPAPLDAHGFATDLREGLLAAGVPGPYVLVGHSMGSLIARSFATTFSEEVAGIVLIDPRYLGIEAHEAAIYPDREPTGAEPTLGERYLAPLAARLGLMRLVDPLGDYVDQLPPESAARARAALASTRQWEGALPDALLGERAADLLEANERLDETPLLVLSGGEPDSSAFPPGARERFTALHARMAALSSRGEHRIVAGADHYTIVVDPGYAGAVVGGIRDVVGSSGDDE